MSEVVEVKLGVVPYDDGSGYKIDLRYEKPQERWPTGIVWINHDIICGGEDLDALIEGLQKLKALAALPPPKDAP